MKQLLLVLVAAAVLATSAHAVTVQVEFLSSDTAVYGKVIADGTETPYIWIGAFSVNVGGAGPVQAWCADVEQLIPSWHKWTAEKEQTTPGALDYPDRRADFGMGVLWANKDIAAATNNDAAKKRAALQLAIWESLYDGTSFNLDDGRFKVSWLSVDVKETAKTYLQNWIN